MLTLGLPAGPPPPLRTGAAVKTTLATPAAGAAPRFCPRNNIPLAALRVRPANVNVDWAPAPASTVRIPPVFAVTVRTPRVWLDVPEAAPRRTISPPLRVTVAAEL